VNEDPLVLAQRALDASPSGEALAHVVHERSLMLRFARSRPTQATAVDDVTVTIAVVRQGRVGTASTNGTGDSALADAAQAAADAADAAARSGGAGDYPGFPAGGQSRGHEGYDYATAQLDPKLGGAQLEAAFAACAESGVEAHGTWSAADVGVAVASTSGTAALDQVTDAFMKVTAIARSGRSGYVERTAVASSSVDGHEIASLAAAKAAADGEPERLPPGEYPVVLGADAVGDIAAWVGYLAANGLAYHEGRSAFCDRLGTRVAAARVNLSDSPRYARTLPRAFDAEGVPKAPMPLIQDGVAHRVVHDTRSAALENAHTTGHATAPGGDSFGPVPTNLVLMGGGAADEAELAKPIERGIYITRLWYTNPVRPKETLITGVTRDGTFLIEDGEITRPLVDMRVTDSALGLLDRCQELGARPRLVSEGEFYGRRFAHGVVAPPMRVSSMRFTG
jgi:PmbA protein